MTMIQKQSSPGFLGSRLFFSAAVLGLALLAVSCPSPVLQSFTDLPPVAVHSPESARRPYWFLSAAGGSYRYVLYPAGAEPSEPVWVEFDVADPAQCPEYNDADSLLVLETVLGTVPTGPARVLSPARVYFLPPVDFIPVHGASWGLLLERHGTSGWERLLTRPVMVALAVPAAPSLPAIQPAPAPDPRPTWSWTGPTGVVSYSCVLYRAIGDAKSGEPVEMALVAARLPEDDAVDGTVGGFRPIAPLDPEDGWDYILEVCSVDAAGNQSAVLSIPKLVIPSLDDLKPLLAAREGPDELMPNDEGHLVTASATPVWTWTGTGKETAFRYQLQEGVFSAAMSDIRWVVTGIAESERSFNAGIDTPRQDAAPAALGQGAWTLYVQAYFVALGGWADAGHLTVEVTGNPPPDPDFALDAVTRTNDTTPTWTWDLAAGTTTAERELVKGYQWELAANPRTPDDPEMVLSGLVNPAESGSAFTFTPDFQLADGNATLRVWTLDERGVRSRQSASLLVIVDTVAPRLFAVNSLVGSLGTAIKAGDPAFPDEESPLLPVDGSYELVFSKAMDAGTVAAAVSLKEGINPVAFSINANTTGMRYTIVPTTNLSQGSSFSIAIATSAADLAGNVLDSAATRNFDIGILASSVSSAVVPDANLRGALARSATAYALANGGLATEVYLHQLQIVENDSFGIDDDAVQDLKGIEFCTAMHTLRLTHDETGVSRLALSGQGHLSSLARLRTLALEGYLAVDAAGLPEALTNLSLAGSAVTSSLELQNLSGLLYLDLKKTDLSDFSFLSLPAGTPDLSGLVTLDLSGTALDDTGKAQLSGLVALRYLNLANTDISGDLVALQNLVKLEHLDVTGNQLSSLTGLSGATMTSLRSLSAKGNDLVDTSHAILGALTSLEYLYLCENKFTSLPDMGLLTKLKVARFADQKLASLAVTVTLNGSFDDQDATANGSFLDLSGNGITSLAIGATVFRGEVVDLSGNALTGTEWAAKTLDVREIDLSSNSSLGADTSLVTNLTKIPGITFLDLTGCGVSTDNINLLKAQWPAATIVSP